MRSLSTVAVSIFLVLHLTGCSFALAHRPRRLALDKESQLPAGDRSGRSGPDDAAPQRECVGSVAAPVLDTVGAIAGTLFAVAAVGSFASPLRLSVGHPNARVLDHTTLRDIATLGLLVSPGVLFTSSAIYGFVNTSNCRSAKLDLPRVSSHVPDEPARF